MSLPDPLSESCHKNEKNSSNSFYSTHLRCQNQKEIYFCGLYNLQTHTMKKFYLLLAVAAMLGTAVNAQLAKKAVSGKQHQSTKAEAKRTSVMSAKRTNPSNRVATTFWSDDFSNAGNWVLSAGSGTADNWVIGTTGPSGPYMINAIASATAANGFALFDSDLLCSSNQDGLLTTANSIDLSSATSARLKFSQYYRRYFDSTFVYISNDGGTNWTEIPLNTITQDNNYNSNDDATGAVNPEIVYIDITSIAAGQANVKVRFRFLSNSTFGASGGCGYSWQLDDISIEDVPANDIAIAEVADPSPYSCVPLLQVQPLTLGARVNNPGSAAATNVSVTFNVYDANFNQVYNDVASFSGTLNPGDTTAMLTAPGSFTPSDTGIYYFEYICAMAAADANTSNDSQYTFMYVDFNDYARDLTYLDANFYNGGLGFNGNVGYLGQMFDVYAASDFTEVDFFLADATLGDTISVDVFDVAAGVPNAVIATTGTYYITAADTGGAFITLPLSSPLTVAPGQYFVGLHQQSVNNVTIGSATDIFTPNSAFFQVNGGTWNPVEVAFNIAFILRVRNPYSSASGIASVTNSGDLMVYPNPSNGAFTLSSDAKNATVTVTNTLGQTVYTNRFDSMNQVRIDLGTQANGVYTVRVQSDAGVMTRNITISNR